MGYYDILIGLSWLILITLSIQVSENARFDKTRKKQFITTYVVVAVAALGEWGSVRLNGAPPITRPLHMVMNAMDFIFTPIAAIMFIGLFNERNHRRKIKIGLICCNTVLQIVSVFTGWISGIDKNNYYQQGRFYFIYVILYCLAIVFAMIEYFKYGKQFNSANRGSLYAIFVIIIGAVLVQELSDGRFRVVYLMLSVVSALLYIHFCEFSQLTRDDVLRASEQQVREDSLTGLLNRYAFDRIVEGYAAMDQLPKNCVVISFDVNGLKKMNDTKGHQAGDNLINGAARCVLNAFGSFGWCFRVGGDEFVVIMNAPSSRRRNIFWEFHKQIRLWEETNNEKLSVAVGQASSEEHPEMGIVELIALADEEMYKDKKAFHDKENTEGR